MNEILNQLKQYFNNTPRYKIPDKELIIETTPNCYNSEFFLPL